MQEYQKLNAAKIKLKAQARYQSNAAKNKLRKQAKLDACEKLRQEHPRARKVLSRSAIKKAIGKKFRFGKDHVLVQNYEGKWIKVQGPKVL